MSALGLVLAFGTCSYVIYGHMHSYEDCMGEAWEDYERCLREYLPNEPECEEFPDNCDHLDPGPKKDACEQNDEELALECEEEWENYYADEWFAEFHCIIRLNSDESYCDLLDE